MRRPLGEYGWAFNLPAEDPYEVQPPVASFDLRDAPDPVQSELALVTFIALSTTPRGEAMVMGVKARGTVRFDERALSSGGAHYNPIQAGWKLQGPNGKTYAITGTNEVYVFADMAGSYYVDCFVEADEYGPDSNVPAGASMTFADAYDLKSSQPGHDPTLDAVLVPGTVVSAIGGGRAAVEGTAPVGSTLVVRDVREDTVAIAGAAADAFTPLWSRVPVRGPVQVELGLATTATGYVEDDGPDLPQTISPLRPAGDAERVRGVVVQAQDGLVHLGDVPVGNHEVSLFQHAPSAGGRVEFGYVPSDRAAPGAIATPEALAEHTVATIDVPGGVAGFQQILDRIPVRGPGAIFANVVTGGQPVTLYGLVGV